MNVVESYGFKDDYGTAVSPLSVGYTLKYLLASTQACAHAGNISFARTSSNHNACLPHRRNGGSPIRFELLELQVCGFQKTRYPRRDSVLECVPTSRVVWHSSCLGHIRDEGQRSNFIASSSFLLPLTHPLFFFFFLTKI